jgi:subtilase family serine protease
MKLRSTALASLALALVFTVAAVWPSAARAQSVPPRAVIRTPIDDTQLVRLQGNTRPEANTSNDRGRVSDDLPLRHMQLLLKRPVERESALQTYIAQLHDRNSPSFHRWLNAAQFGQRFGLAPQDIAAVTAWLRQHGFVINAAYPSSTVIDFSGTAGQVRAVFHTEIHALTVGGVRHIANMGDPQIPVALAPAVAGIVSLHDFRPHTLNRPRADYTLSSGRTLVVPADLATIYHLNPLFAQGYSGQNQTIVVIEDTDVYSSADWSTFRSTFGLSGYSAGSFTQFHPPSSGTNDCTDPGIVSGADLEAILDAEWASAAAPSAAIELASCADVGTTFGGLIALQNLLNQSGSPPAIISISYGECEALNGATANAAYTAAYQQAVAAGVSLFVAAGDSGAAACDQDASAATDGIGVNAFASTPYNVAVGGTDFGDTYQGTSSHYWGPTNNASPYGSALSYIPEIPWDDSCASALIASYEGDSTPYGSSGFCNSSAGANFLNTVAGSGGPSSCATGAPALATPDVVSGTCVGAPKPSWQSGVPGIPADGVRDLPDLSLFAGNGVWGHYYVVCWSNTGEKYGALCTGPPSGWTGAGGTSFAAPILAGIQALINQSLGGQPQGNPNYVYYALAASQAASGLACNSSLGNTVANGCVFYDVTQGDMDVDCKKIFAARYDCYLPSGTYGVLSTSNTSFNVSYGTTAGWDFATGIGSVNAANLAYYWNSADVWLNGKGSVTSAGLLSYALTVGDRGPQSASGVAVSATLPPGLNLISAMSGPNCSQRGQTVSCVVGNLADGSMSSVTVVLQPSVPSQIINLTFTATSSNADINPSDGADATSLNWSGQGPGEGNVGDGDGPLPLWANLALGLLLLVTASWHQHRQKPARS